jgi:hypothetical protein
VCIAQLRFGKVFAEYRFKVRLKQKAFPNLLRSKCNWGELKSNQSQTYIEAIPFGIVTSLRSSQ